MLSGSAKLRKLFEYVNYAVVYRIFDLLGSDMRRLNTAEEK